MQAAIGWLALRTPRTVTAERFVLRDPGGQTRGEWGATQTSAGEQDGQPVVASVTCLHMQSTGRSRARLCAPWDEPGEARLTLADGTGSQAALVASPYNGQLMLTARGRAEDQKPRSLALLMASHLDSGVTLRHADKTSMWTSAGPGEAP